MKNLNEIKKGFTKVNSQGQLLTVNQVNYGFKNGGTDKEYDFRVDIDGVEYWFNDCQLLNFINN